MIKYAYKRFEEKLRSKRRFKTLDKVFCVLAKRDKSIKIAMSFKYFEVGCRACPANRLIDRSIDRDRDADASDGYDGDYDDGFGGANNGRGSGSDDGRSVDADVSSSDGGFDDSDNSLDGDQDADSGDGGASRSYKEHAIDRSELWRIAANLRDNKI